MRAPSCLFNNFLKHCSVFSDNKSRFLCVDDYLAKTRIEVYVSHFGFYRDYVSSDFFGFDFVNPYRRIRTDDNSFPYNIDYVGDHTALFNQNLWSLCIDSQRRSFILYSGHFSLFWNMF